jgi:hypothetical protein
MPERVDCAREGDASRSSVVHRSEAKKEGDHMKALGIAAVTGIVTIMTLCSSCTTTGPGPGTTGPVKAQHKALAAKASASSTHAGASGEEGAQALIDGNLKTRWSSDYSEPQHVVLSFGHPVTFNKIRMHWEAAAAREYNVLVSGDGQAWKSVASITNAAAGPRVDEVNGAGVKASFLKLDLLKRVNTQWGFSLYEIEIAD